jgi:opacity protein-like surface antigen
MRFSYAVLLAAGTALVSIPAAFAQDNGTSGSDMHWNKDWQSQGWYASGSAGLSSLEDSSTGSNRVNFKAKYDNPGFDVHGAIGRELGSGVRAEGEIGYQKINLAKIGVSNGGLGGLRSGQAGGDSSALSVMANGYYDFQTGTRWKPYVGVGLGVARVNADGMSVNNVQIADDEDAVFAYQAMVGLGYDVTSTGTAYIGYRYFGTEDPTFTDGSNERFKLPFNSNSVEMGYRYKF